MDEMSERERRTVTAMCLVAGITIVLTMAAYAYGDAPDEWWYVVSVVPQLGSAWVPVYFVDYITEEMCPNDDEKRGCYIHGPNVRAIYIVEGKEFEWANQGCTVHDHEYYHAMGYAHGVGPLSTTCPNPDWDFSGNDLVEAMTYNRFNIHHWNPMYEHVPFDSGCPRCE